MSNPKIPTQAPSSCNLLTTKSISKASTLTFEWLENTLSSDLLPTVRLLDTTLFATLWSQNSTLTSTTHWSQTTLDRYKSILIRDRCSQTREFSRLKITNRPKDSHSDFSQIKNITLKWVAPSARGWSKKKKAPTLHLLLAPVFSVLWTWLLTSLSKT